MSDGAGKRRKFYRLRAQMLFSSLENRTHLWRTRKIMSPYYRVRAFVSRQEWIPPAAVRRVGIGGDPSR